MRRLRHSGGDNAVSYAAAAALVLGVLLIGYIAFGHPTIGGAYDVRAVVRDANQLRGGSPVRIAGVDVGQITSIDPGPGHTSMIKMRISDRGRPLHSDATLKIRPRLFLEGGYYVDLRSGSPSAPELGSGATIPLGQTATPVQLNDLLSSFTAPSRDSFQTIVTELDTALSGGGADGLRRTTAQLAPVMRDLAWVAQAARGTQPHDVSRLVRSSARVTSALAGRSEDLTALVDNIDTTARALTADSGALGRTVRSLDNLLKVAPPALTSVDSTLPALARFSRAVEPGLRGAPRALTRISSAVSDLAALVEPRERERVLRALSVTFKDLPTLVNRLAALFPVTQPLTECLDTHVTPILNEKVPDAELSTGRPVWQDFAHGLVGLSGNAQNFDGNGYSVRYLSGLGNGGFSTESIPGLGQIFGAGPSALGVRPVWLGRGVDPPYRPDARCADQPLPDLTSTTGAPAMRASSAPRQAPRTSLREVRSLLRSPRLRKALRRAGS